MPFAFSIEETDALPERDRLVEDRRNNPVRNRSTVFRLAQYNMLAYTFPDFVPGFTNAGINRFDFAQLVARPVENAVREGQHFFGQEFVVTREQVAKVAGDVFETVEAAIHWNAAARWNRLMRVGDWEGNPRYPRPGAARAPNRQIAVLSLPRGYDWVRLLTPAAAEVVQALRDELAQTDLMLPTSTPDLLVVALPAEYRGEERFLEPLRDLGRSSQRILSQLHREMEGRIEPEEFILAIALKKSLRSDRLYQPLYEANIMQLLLEGRLGAPQVDFEVHTLQSAGTKAVETYRSASLAAVATRHAEPHRAVRDLHEPAHAEQLVRRFLSFLDARMSRVPPP